MDEGKMKTILMKIKAGEKRTESWFLRQCSDAELQEMVENGYLITIPKIKLTLCPTHTIS